MKILIFIFGIILIGFIVVQLFALNSQRNIETYEYVVNKKYDTFELRSYEATLFTSVKLSTKGYNNSSSRGFSILADYIFGGNEKNQKIDVSFLIKEPEKKISTLKINSNTSSDLSDMNRPISKDSKITKKGLKVAIMR